MSTELATGSNIEVFGGYRSKHTPVFSGAGFGGAYRYKFRFPNGYGASLIIGGIMAYGGLELAVIEFGSDDDEDFDLVYDTPITSDVVGYISGPTEVEDLLDRIAALPPRTTALEASQPIAISASAVVDPGDTQ